MKPRVGPKIIWHLGGRGEPPRGASCGTRGRWVAIIEQYASIEALAEQARAQGAELCRTCVAIEKKGK